MNELRSRTLSLGLLAAGLIPALVILILFRLEDGQLQVAGQAVADYNLAQLLAALSSLARPVLILTPLALAGRETPMRPFLLIGLFYPALLLGPSLLSGLIIGGGFDLIWLRALALLCALGFCLTLWAELLTRFIGSRLTILVYGLIWATSTYTDHLRLYVLPYLEIAALKVVNIFNWILPQIGSGPSAIDDLLQVGEIEATALLPTAIQLPILLIGYVLLVKKQTAPSGET